MTTTEPQPVECVSATPGNRNKPEKWAPTKNPNRKVTPGKMRSDCEEIPGGFTKEQADKAETMEAAVQSVDSAEGGPTVMVAPGCQVYWPAPYEVCGAIRDKYNELGGPNSFLLWPTSNELTNPDGVGRRNTFTNGPIYWSPWGGAHPVANHFFAAWQRHGWESGYLGYPRTDEIPAAGGGLRQEFDGAAIYWHLNEAYAIGGAIRDKWNSVGAEGGPLGYPTSDELSVVKYGGRHNNFENGTILWSGQTGTRLLYGAVRDRWESFGREDGEMGFPTTDEQVAQDGVGHFVNFEDGSAIYWYPVIGAWRLTPGVLQIFAHFGGESGKFGYPTSAVEPVSIPQASNGVGQGFQNGSIIYVDKGDTYAYYTATY
ncbi:LGFP repeat-containing protein [Nocardia fluminea]|uniref:LGFP repeat-containing protein n=1 Tax=Nocardia fluminea TaxID=134984 RepID=UPI003D0DCB96